MEVHSKIMNRDEEILDVIRGLANAGGKTVSLTLIYRQVAGKGIYTANMAIKNSLKRLESQGKIKTTSMDKIELLE